MDTRDSYGHSALYLIYRIPFSIDLLRLPVDAGADPTWVNYDGNTIMHEALKLAPLMGPLTQVRFLKVLLELSVPMIQKNYSGAIPLHIACSTYLSSGSAQIRKAIIDLLLQLNFRMELRKETIMIFEQFI